MAKMGRPKEVFTLTRDGHKFTLWLNNEENEFLVSIARKLRVSKAEIIRKILQGELTLEMIQAEINRRDITRNK